MARNDDNATSNWCHTNELRVTASDASSHDERKTSAEKAPLNIMVRVELRLGQ